MSASQPSGGQRVVALDGIRGISILLVMVSHFTLLSGGHSVDRVVLMLVGEYGRAWSRRSVGQRTWDDGPVTLSIRLEIEPGEHEAHAIVDGFGLAKNTQVLYRAPDAAKVGARYAIRIGSTCIAHATIEKAPP